VFTDLKNHGLDDMFMPVFAGLKGRREAVESVWPGTMIQT
jgi:transposase-like protein